MSQTLLLEIVTPTGASLRQDVDEVSVPSVTGEFGVLPGHLPIVAALKTGLVSWKHGGLQHACAVGAGFVEVSGDHVSILTDRYQTKEAIDPVLVRATLHGIEEELRGFSESQATPAFQELVAKELWCAAQLELHGDPPPPTLHFASAYGPAFDNPEQREEGPAAALADDNR